LCDTWDIAGHNDIFVVTRRETVNLKPIDVTDIIDVQCFMLYGFILKAGCALVIRYK